MLIYLKQLEVKNFVLESWTLHSKSYQGVNTTLEMPPLRDCELLFLHRESWVCSCQIFELALHLIDESGSHLEKQSAFRGELCNFTH